MPKVEARVKRKTTATIKNQATIPHHAFVLVDDVNDERVAHHA